MSRDTALRKISEGFVELGQIFGDKLDPQAISLAFARGAFDTLRKRLGAEPVSGSRGGDRLEKRSDPADDKCGPLEKSARTRALNCTETRDAIVRKGAVADALSRPIVAPDLRRR